jgi:hypothetical protein
MSFRDRRELYVRKNPWEGTIVGVFDEAFHDIQDICQRCTKILAMLVIRRHSTLAYLGNSRLISVAF